MNKLVKLSGALWTASLSSLIIFSIIGYTTPKQTTGYHCLTCPTGLYYNTNTGTCQYFINCTLNQFWSGTTCVDKYTYNSQTCTNSTQCLSPMTCNLVNSVSTCNCPATNTLNKCDCPIRVSGNEYFSNGTTCTSAVSFGNICYGNHTCQYLTQNTFCNGTCQCALFQYFNTNQYYCVNQLLINQSCILTTDCRTDLGLSCQTGVCQCNTSSFWNGSSCVVFYTYNNQTCSSSSQCMSPLVCNLAGSSCNCPAAVPINKCDCPRSIGNEYYWNGATCVLAGTYNQPCNIVGNYTCQYLTQNTFCNSATGVCDCGSNGLWNSSTCLYCPVNWRLFYNSCVIGSSAAVLFTSLTPTIIFNNCYNVTNARLGRMHIDGDGFLSLFGDLIAFPQSYYFFDAYYAAGGAYYMSSDGQYTLIIDSYYWHGPYTLSNSCSMFKLAGRWFVTSACNVVEYFLCEVELI